LKNIQPLKNATLGVGSKKSQPRERVHTGTYREVDRSKKVVAQKQKASIQGPRAAGQVRVGVSADQKAAGQKLGSEKREADSLIPSRTKRPRGRERGSKDIRPRRVFDGRENRCPGIRKLHLQGKRSVFFELHNKATKEHESINNTTRREIYFYSGPDGVRKTSRFGPCGKCSFLEKTVRGDPEQSPRLIYDCRERKKTGCISKQIWPY